MEIKDAAIKDLMAIRVKRNTVLAREKRAEEYAMKKQEEAKAATQKYTKMKREKAKLEGDGMVKVENRLLRQMAGYPFQDSKSKEYAHEAIKGFEDILYKAVNGQTYEIRWISRNGDLAKLFLDCMIYDETEDVYKVSVTDFRNALKKYKEKIERAMESARVEFEKLYEEQTAEAEKLESETVEGF